MKPAPGLPFPPDPHRFARRLLDLLEQLLALGGCSTEPAELQAKADWLAAELAARGLQVEQVAGEQGPHLAAWTPGCPERGYVALVGHHDTVYPPSPKGYRLRREGDLVIGPTVADMSGGLVVILGALELLGEGPPPSLRVLLCSDEERGSPTGREFLARWARGAAEALVFEAGREGDGMVLGRRGREGFRLTVWGREAHAGIDPERGVNALAEAAALVGPMEAEARARGASLVLGGVTHVLPGAVNTVPGRVDLSGDMRFADPAVREPLLARLQTMAQQTPARQAGAELPPNRLERTAGRPAWQPSPADRALCRRYQEVASRLGITLRPLQAGGGSDANLLAHQGTPVIDGLGPVGRNFHRPDETIALPTLLERTTLTAAYLHGVGPT